MAGESKSNLLNRGLGYREKEASLERSVVVPLLGSSSSGGSGGNGKSMMMKGESKDHYSHHHHHHHHHYANGKDEILEKKIGNNDRDDIDNDEEDEKGKKRGGSGSGKGKGKGEKDKDDSVKLFGVNLSAFPNYIQFLILLMVIMLGFLLIGFVEEGFKHTFPDFTFGWFMTAIELMLFTVLAAMERILKETNPLTMSSGIGSSSSSGSSSHTMNNDHNNNTNNNSITITTTTTSSNVGESMNIHHKMDDNCGGRITGTSTDNNNNNNNNNLNSHIHNTHDYRRDDDDVKVTTKKNNGNEKHAFELLLDKNNSFNQNLWNRILSRKVPLIYHIIVAIAMTASRGLTNISLLLMNYPTQVIFKSMKLISVMIGSKIFLNKDYNIYEYLAAPLMVGAAIAFSLGDARETLNFNLWGIIVVVVSLVFDSIHANAQEYTLKLHRDTALELLLYSNFFSGIFAAIVGICAGELGPLFIFLASRSLLDILCWFTVRVLCLYIGVAALVVFTQRFGAVAAVTITTVRKILTVLLSYVLWPDTKSFGRPHAFGTIMFIGSLILNGAGVHYKTHS